MSNFTNLNEIFHIFSKTPVADGQTLASARNKSGHTVTTSDVWAEDIPAFFSAPTQSYIDNLKTIAKDNDLCYDETNKSILYFKNDNWVQRNALKDGELLANYEASKSGIFNDGSLNDESKAVVKYYKDRDAIAIDGDNNNTADGNRYTARIAKDNNSFVQQFVSSMDKIVNGNPSSYYEPVVNGGNITEDIKDKGDTTKYIANNYSGIIQFHKQMVKTSEGKLKDITISAFEYIGKTLTDVLKGFETVGSGRGISYKIYIPTKELPLPEPSIEYKNIILLVPEEPQGPYYMPPSAISGGYVEWLCVNKGTDEAPSWAWEQIGTTEADLSDYIKLIELNGKQLKVQDNNYVKLGSLVEDVATTYNSLAGSYVVENGVTQKYQSFNAAGVPNHESISVGITKNGEIAIGVQTATDEVYGLSKMFTSAIPSTPATDETTINEHKKTAVSVKSASEMYNSLATAITGVVNDPTAYVFPNKSAEERKYFIIYDAWENPVLMSKAFQEELVDGYRLFDYKPWKKFHIDMPNLETQYRMFHSNYNLVSFKSDISNLSTFDGMFHGDLNLQYVDIIISSSTNGINKVQDCFTTCNKLKHITITSDNSENIGVFLQSIPANNGIKNKKIILKKTDGIKYTNDEIRLIVNTDTVRNNGWEINQ